MHFFFPLSVSINGYFQWGVSSEIFKIPEEKTNDLFIPIQFYLFQRFTQMWDALYPVCEQYPARINWLPIQVGNVMDLVLFSVLILSLYTLESSVVVPVTALSLLAHTQDSSAIQWLCTPLRRAAAWSHSKQNYWYMQKHHAHCLTQ